MLSGSLAQSCSLARLTVHALLAHFRLLMSDLENLRHACARAQIFQVRQQDSKGIEHSMYRKTVLTHFEEKRQHLATYGWTYSNEVESRKKVVQSVCIDWCIGGLSPKECT